MTYFVQYKNGTIINSVTVDPDCEPIWLIPGIHGRGQELMQLAAELDAKRGGKTPIFIYDEDRLKDDSLLSLSLDELTKKMLDEIIELTDGMISNIQLVGYSSGAILGSILSSKLAEHGLVPRLVAIDQPDMTSVTQYIAQNSDHLMRDLINVVNVAARHAGMTETEIDFTADEIKEARNFLELEQRISSLALSTKAKCPNAEAEAVNKFYEYLNRAKRNLTYPEESSPQHKINSTHLIITKGTALKYGATDDNWEQFNGGWKERSKGFKTHISPTLANKGHLDLLRGECAQEVANIISQAFHSDFNLERAYQFKLELLQRSYQAQLLKRGATSESLPPILGNPEQSLRVSRTSGTLFSQFNGSKSAASTPSSENTAITPVISLSRSTETIV